MSSNRTTLEQYAGTDIPANTGLSATLIQRRGTNEYTLAIRSTEFRPATDGGDRSRDAIGADVLGIFSVGFALAQLSSLQDYYAWLRSSNLLPDGASLTVTGYSLGGHLATVFTEMHANDTGVVLEGTVTFNGAGRGTWSRNADDPSAIVGYYRTVLGDPSSAESLLATAYATDSDRAEFTAARDLQAAGQPLDPLSVYNDPRHTWAQTAARLMFGLSGSSLFDQGSGDLRNGAAGKITQIYGKEFSPEWTGVANSGVHGPATGVFVEAQPLLEIPFATNGGATDFGNGHAIVLLADSLALMRAFQSLDATVSLETMNRLLAASSDRYARSLPSAAAEDNALENALDGLRRLFLGPDAPPTAYAEGAGGFGNFDYRNAFHANLDALASDVAFQGVAGQARLVDLSALTRDDTVAAARGEVAYRYALRELNPFAITGAPQLYEAHNANGELDLYDAASPERGGMSEAWLQDRAAFLAWRLTAHLANRDRIPGPEGPDNWRFTDRALGYQLSVVGQTAGGDSTAPSHLAVFGTEFADVVAGGAESDRLYGGRGADYFAAGRGDDYLEGGGGRDIYQYDASSTLGIGAHDGHDVILDADGAGVLRYTFTPTFGGQRNTVIADASVKVSDTRWRSADGTLEYELAADAQGRRGLVVTFPGDGGGSLTLQDFRDGDYGIRLAQPVLRAFADPAGSVIGTAASESLAGTPGHDYIAALEGADAVSAGAGDDLVFGAQGNDSLYGEAGNDRLYGDAGRDSLFGGDGNDALHGGADVDILEGGAGDDLLAGEAGSDAVIGGDGNDEIYAGDAASLSSALALGESETPAGIRGEWVDGGEGGDTVAGGPGNDQVMGGGGADVLAGGAGDDNLIGDAERAVLHVDNWLVTRSVATQGDATTYQLVYNGYAQIAESPNPGADTIYGGAGADWIYAGAGDDLLAGGTGADLLLGEAGSDILSGGDGDDVLVGDNPGVVSGANEGNDILDGGSGDDRVYGNGGDDVLFGSPGEDTLSGGAGRDTYIVHRGDGVEVIFDTPADADDPEASVLVLGQGITRDTVKFRPGSLLVDLGGGDGVHVEGFSQLDPASTPVLGAIEFADGSRMSYADILAQGFDVDGTEQSDDGHDALHPQLVGTGVGDRIRGYGGNDQLFGLAGGDLLEGGAGNDALIGDAGSDTLDGGAGADTLWGGEGDDQYFFGRGSGADVVADQDAAPGNADAIVLAADLSPEDIALSRGQAYGADLVVSIRGTADRLTVADHFGASGEYRVEQIRFGDGAAWDAQAIADRLYAGTGGADAIVGSAAGDFLRGFDGNDTLRGAGGDDTLDGGPGSDLLYGEGGADVYRFARGGGQDAIGNADADPSGTTDALEFAADIAPSQVSIARSGYDLVLGIAGSGDQVALRNYFLGDTAIVEEIRFADGTVWTERTIAALYPLSGTSGNDNLVGSGLSENISVFAGNDTVHGAYGNDTIDGGAGSDVLYGDGGNDVLLAGAGDAKNAAVSNTLYGGSGDDVLVASNKRDYLYGEAGNDIYIGGTNADWMEDTGGSNLFFGAAGADSVWLGDDRDIAMAFDSLDGDRDVDGVRGRDVLLVNKSENASVTRIGTGSTLSLGGGVLYKDLALQAQNNLLTVKYGTKTTGFLDWYGDSYTPPNRSVAYLQIVIEGTRDYNASSSNPMNNRKIQVFDFQRLVAAFDAARAAGQGFNVAAELPKVWLWSADTEAIGGAVAYQYARTGTLGTLTYDQMRAVITDPAFTLSAQPIAPAATGAASLEAPAQSEPLAASSATVEPSVQGDALAVAESPAVDTSGAERTPRAGAIDGSASARRAVLPAPAPLDTQAPGHAAAWRRIARELPPLLDTDPDAGLVTGAASPRARFGVGVLGVGVRPEIGVGERGLERLRTFEGLSEGLAVLA